MARPITKPTTLLRKAADYIEVNGHAKNQLVDLVSPDAGPTSILGAIRAVRLASGASEDVEFDAAQLIGGRIDRRYEMTIEEWNDRPQVRKSQVLREVRAAAGVKVDYKGRVSA